MIEDYNNPLTDDIADLVTLTSKSDKVHQSLVKIIDGAALIIHTLDLKKTDAKTFGDYASMVFIPYIQAAAVCESSRCYMGYIKLAA